jgi:hypothetical protein
VFLVGGWLLKNVALSLYWTGVMIAMVWRQKQYLDIFLITYMILINDVTNQVAPSFF